MATRYGLNDDILEAMYRLALRYYSHEMYDDSVCLLEYLSRHRPNRAEVYFALGKAKHAKSEYQEAIINYERAVLMGLASIEVYLYIGQCMIFLHQLPNAEAALRKFLALAKADVNHEKNSLFQRGTHLLNDLIVPQLKRVNNG